MLRQPNKILAIRRLAGVPLQRGMLDFDLVGSTKFAVPFRSSQVTQVNFLK